MTTNTYAETLEAAKQDYPFTHWREHWQKALSQEIESTGVEDSNAVQLIFDQLIAGLIKLGEDASEKKKVKLFQKAIEATNSYGHIIETVQAEELWELTNTITVACGLDPDDYGDGEGLISEWREW